MKPEEKEAPKKLNIKKISAKIYEKMWRDGTPFTRLIALLVPAVLLMALFIEFVLGGSSYLSSEEYYTLLFVVAPGVLYFWRKVEKRKKAEKEKQERIAQNKKIEAGADAANKSSFAEILKDVEGFFSNHANEIQVFIACGDPKLEGRVLLKVSRPLHTMSKKEIYATKSAFTLFEDNTNSIAMRIKAIIYDEGKRNHEVVSSTASALDGPLILKFSQQIPRRSSEDAANFMIDYINKKSQEDPVKYKNLLASDNRWFSAGDFSEDSQISPYMQTPDSLFLGIMNVGNNEATKTFYTGERSLIDIAPPGSGKTQCHMLINLRNSPCSAIVLDIKSECYDETAKHREKFLGSDVYRFAPEDPASSHCYNPLSFISKDEDEVWEQSRFLAEMLSPLSDTADKSWELDGQSFLTLTIAYVVLEKDNPTMADVLDIVSGAELEEMLENILDNKDKYSRAMFRTATSHSNTYDKSEKQWQGVQKAANQHLQVWEGAKMEKVTRKTDWAPEDFRKPGTTLYLCIPPNAIETYAPALRVIIGQHVRHLMADGQMEAFKNTGYPIIFYLDELPRLGSMEPIREALDVGRSYGLKLWLITQYTHQLEKAYPGLAEGMMDSCGVQIYMNPGDKDAQKISKRLGKQKDVLDGKEQAMVEPHELTGPDYKNDMVVFVNGEKPTRLHKVFDYEIEWPKEAPEEAASAESIEQEKAA